LPRLCVGEVSRAKWALYVCAELAGAVAAALVAAIIDPTAPSLSGWSVEDGSGPGCVPALAPPQYFSVFGWELVGTFVLCGTVLATAVAKPGFGDLAPLAIGMSVAINVGTSGSITGGAYNPARFFGPAVVFGCRLHLVWLYWGAQATGALLAAGWHLGVVEKRDAAPGLLPRGMEMSSTSPTPSELASPSPTHRGDVV